MATPVILVDGQAPPPLGAKANGRKGPDDVVALTISANVNINSIEWKVDCTPGSSATLSEATPVYPFATTLTLNGYGTYRITCVANSNQAGNELVMATVYVPTRNKQLRVPIPGEEKEYDADYWWHDAIAGLINAADSPTSDVASMTIDDPGISNGSIEAGSVLCSVMGNSPKAVCIQAGATPTGGDYVWVFSSGIPSGAPSRDFWRFDTDTLEITKFTLSQAFGSDGDTVWQGAVFGNGSLWVTTATSVLRINPTSGQLVAEITPAVGDFIGIAYDSATATVWVVTKTGEFYGLDATPGAASILRSGLLTGAAANPGMIAASGYIWVPTQRYVYRIAPLTGTVTGSVDYGSNTGLRGLAFTGTKMFTFATGASLLKRFDPTTLLFEAGANLSVSGYTFYSLVYDSVHAELRLLVRQTTNGLHYLSMVRITSLAANPPTNSGVASGFYEIDGEGYGPTTYANFVTALDSSGVIFGIFPIRDFDQFVTYNLGPSSERHFSIVSHLAFRQPPLFTNQNKYMIAEVTAADGDLACADPVAVLPYQGSAMMVYVNGLFRMVGPGVTANVDCYFSGDGGITAREVGNIREGDLLYWVGSYAGFELSGSDHIDFVYLV